MRGFQRYVLVFANLLVMNACTCGEQQRRMPGANSDASNSDSSLPNDTGVFTFDAQNPDSGGGFDPFDPNNRCAGSTIPTNRVPGTVLIVFDFSTSMRESVSGTTSTRWQLATTAVRNALMALPDDLSVGLVRFPTSACNVATGATVAIGPLSQTRMAILASLNPSSPPPSTGNATPLVQAIDRGDAVLRMAQSMGGRGLLVVTDGFQSCPVGAGSTLVGDVSMSVQRAGTRNADGIRTFVVGLETESGYLSQLAQAGGTARASCNPFCRQYVPRECASDFDCEDTCLPSGICNCVRDSDCGSDLRCNQQTGVCDPINGNTNCCNYTIGATNFQTEFQRAIEEVSSGFRGDCTFEVPRDPNNTFDPALVNVGVTFAGQPRVVVPSTSNTAVNGWHYTNSMNQTLEISGPLCEQLRQSQANVEIVLGCPSVIP